MNEKEIQELWFNYLSWFGVLVVLELIAINNLRNSIAAIIINLIMALVAGFYSYKFTGKKWKVIYGLVSILFFWIMPFFMYYLKSCAIKRILQSKKEKKWFEEFVEKT